MGDPNETLSDILRRLLIEEEFQLGEHWRELIHGAALEPNQKSFKSLNNMKKETVEQQKDDEICSICHEQMNQAVNIPEEVVVQKELKVDKEEFPSKIIIMPCEHRFHMFCLTLWLEKKQTCPLCRDKVKSDGEYSIEEREKRVQELHDNMYG